jgi:broad specificity phosphatase PhoE
MRQADQLAQRVFAHGFVHILCSDLLRARDGGADCCLLGDYN